MSIPQCLRSHPLFQAGISRQEAEFILAVPGNKCVLRQNKEKNKIVFTFLQSTGAIGHAFIDIEGDGRVRTERGVFASIDQFVAHMLDATFNTPSPDDVRRIPGLAEFIMDPPPRKTDLRAALAKLPFVLRRSKTANGWVVTRLKADQCTLSNLLVRLTRAGFVVDSRPDRVYGSLWSVLEDAGLVVATTCARSQPIYAIVNVHQQHYATAPLRAVIGEKSHYGVLTAIEI
jgi:hypothetical protein